MDALSSNTASTVRPSTEGIGHVPQDVRRALEQPQLGAGLTSRASSSSVEPGV